MIPQFCRVRHDPEAGTVGDCVRACVASILELEPEQVPHFFHDNCDGPEGHRRMSEWLATLNIAPFISAYDGTLSLDQLLAFMDEYNPHATYMLFGKTRDGGGHVVVCKGGKIVHDPAWYRVPLIGPPDDSVNWNVVVLAVK